MQTFGCNWVSKGHVDVIDERLPSERHMDDDVLILLWALFDTVWC